MAQWDGDVSAMRWRRYDGSSGFSLIQLVALSAPVHLLDHGSHIGLSAALAAYSRVSADQH